jgi:hypothetical protein
MDIFSAVSDFIIRVVAITLCQPFNLKEVICLIDSVGYSLRFPGVNYYSCSSGEEITFAIRPVPSEWVA